MTNEAFDRLGMTEQILFRTMKKVQRDRVEHQKASEFSEGSKQREHRLKAAACLGKESVLESVLEQTGLYELYREWSGLYQT